MLTKSIRARLTAWYVLILAAILTVFCGILYIGLSHLLYTSLDRSLRIQADAIADSYDWDNNEFEALHEGEDKFEEGLLTPWIRIFRDNGQLYYTSPAFRTVVAPFPLDKVRELEELFFENLQLNDGRKLRSVIYPVEGRHRRFGWVQIATPLSEVTEPLRTLLLLMVLSVPAILLFVGGGGYFLARRTLQPVDKMRQQAELISEKNLDAKLEVSNPHDELGNLAQTFNRMLEQLKAAFDSQRRFLADASHELKTPLAVLRSHWEGEIENPKMPDEMKKKLVTDVEELARLSKLVENLLLLSRVDETEMLILNEKVDLQKVLKEVYEDGKVLAANKKQTIEIIHSELVIVLGDKNRLYQLFLNLVDNAVKYTPEGGRVSLSLKKQNNEACIEVRDSGMGIPPKDLPRIFDRFYRVDKARSRKLGGSGLGLSICKWIAEAHGGSIEVASELGKGTRVIVRLPLF